MQQSNVPNQRTVRGHLTIKSFISPENPSLKDLETYDKETNNFLKTIDNKRRFLNGRNSYAVGKKVYTLIWFLEKIQDEPVTKPFGDKVKPVKPIIDDKDSNTKKKGN